MIHIAIADDDPFFANQAKEYIMRYSSENNVPIETTVFTDGDELVENHKSYFDIILLDLNMPLLDGLSAAEEIRRTDPEVIIIFITSMIQGAIKGYSVDALDYMLKPINYFALSRCLSRAMRRIKSREKFYVVIPVNGGFRKLTASDIHYIESVGHTLIFHTENEDIKSTGTIINMVNTLTPYHFFRCNKGYLVNLEYVNGIQDCFALVGKDRLVISRARKKSFMDALTDYMGEK